MYPSLSFDEADDEADADPIEEDINEDEMQVRVVLEESDSHLFKYRGPYE